MRHQTRNALRGVGVIGAGAALVLAVSPWAQAAHANTAPTPAPSTTTTSVAATPAPAPSAAPATVSPSPDGAGATSPPAAPSPPTASATTTAGTSAAPRGATPSATPSATSSVAAGDPAAGAAYLVRQLIGGDHLASSFNGQTFPNYGGTADLAIALASTGTQDGALAKVLTYLEANTAAYADPDGTQGAYPGPYSGAVGKLALVAEITRQDPRSFGGFDLISTLTSHVCAAADTAGSCTAAGDFSQAFSPVSQALDVLALARAGVAPPASAVARLEQLQCSDGGFSSTLIVAGDPCTSDVDTTGFALQALTLVPSASASVGAASQFLLAQQDPDGGFTGAAGENVNSTALAVQALTAAPPAGAKAARAAAAIRPHLASASAVQAGTAYLAASQHASGGFGVHRTDTADDELATAQAVPALAGTTLTSLVHTVAPAAAPPPASTAAPTQPARAVPVAARHLSSATDLPFTGWNAGRWIRIAGELLLAGLAFTVVARLLRRRTTPR